MKITRFKVLLSLNIGLVIFTTNSYSQTNTYRGRTFELSSDKSGATYEYIARDYIQLKPGFSYHGNTARSFTARIDPDLVTQVGTISPIGADTRPLDPTLQVGATPLTINVTPNGGASCDIAIQVPPGSGGLAPSVSISYNSMAGAGLLGIGWNIAGLSAITRTGKTIYHDGIAGGVNLDAGDRFMLDGNRLISISGTYGSSGAEYRSEMQTFSKVISNGSAGTGPLSFTVQTKDGRTLEYGVTADSRVDANVTGKSEIVTWNLNKITDQSGNTLIFTYHKDNSKKEYWPEAITYGDNSVKFFYESVSSTANSYYVAGSEQRQFILLRKIKTFVGSNMAKEYQFEYSLDFYSHLAEVVEYGYDGSRLNSTAITWGPAAAEKLVPGVPSFISPFEAHVFGDFNGDSKMDMVSYPKKSSYTPADKWYLFLNNGVTFDPPTQGSFNDSSYALHDNKFRIAGLNTQDINGDGKDDLLFTEKDGFSVCQSCVSPKKRRIIPYLSTGTGFTPSTYSLLPIVYDEDYHELVQGDFDGDGLMDILVNDRTHSTWKIYFLNKNTTAEGNFFFGRNLAVGDFNGNGINDLISTSGTSYIDRIQLFEYNPADGSMQTLYSSGLSEYHDYTAYFPGDYNGDGKTDLLLTIQDSLRYVHAPMSTIVLDSMQYWEVRYFDGTKFRKNTSFLDVGHLYPGFGNQGNVYTSDFNGDGKCDIVQINEVSTQSGISSSLTVNYSMGFYFQQEIIPFRPEQVRTDSYYPGDFNGDGKMDLYHVDFSTHMGTRYQFSPNEQKHLVHAIANGFNVKSRFVYKPITDPLVYTKGSGAAYPLQDYQGPIQVVAQLISDDGAGASNITSYTYSGAKLHRQGKGFLGFMSYSAKNEKVERITSVTNEIDSYFNMRQKKVTVKSLLPTGPQNISSVEYTNALKTYGSTKINYPYASRIIQTDLLKNIAITTDYTCDDLGNILTKTINHGGEGITTIETSYEAGGAWCASKPDIVTTTQSRPTDFSYTRRVDYNYNANGKPSQMFIDPTKSKRVTHTYAYDSFGNLTSDTWSSTGLAARSITYGYDASGRYVTSEINSLGQAKTMTRDPRDGNILTLTDENLLVTTHEYDPWGRLKKSVTPTGAVITTEYKWVQFDPQSTALYAVVTTPEGKPQATEYYDLFSRKVKSETVGFNGTAVQKEWVYDGKGQLISESKPHGPGDVQHILYEYDDKGRVKRQTNAEAIISFSYAGSKVTMKNEKANQVTSKTTNAYGEIIAAEDGAGVIEYTYYSSGKPREIKTPDGEIIRMQYDEYGRQFKLIDPNAGTTLYDYNAYGELISQTDQKGNVYTLTYDQVGRNITKTGPEGVYTNTYDNRTKGIGKIGTTEGPNGYKTEYFYDSKSRLNEVKETPNNPAKVFTTRYLYDNYNNMVQQTYPDGLVIENSYTTNGYLSEVKQAGALVPIWKGISQNSRGQWEAYAYGNAQAITRTYDPVTGAPASYTSNAVSASGNPVISLAWTFDAATGNLMSRSEGALTEGFAYDNLNRLLASTSPGAPMAMSYSNTGNILSKTHTGEYSYGAGSAGPHAVTQVNNTGIPAMPGFTQDVTYTEFNKIETVAEGDYSMEFTYGADQERRKTELYENGTLLKTKYYSINYERIETPGDVRHISYIPAGDGLAAIYVTDNSGSKLYYVHKDHLGSILLITDDLGVPKETYSYDAWGRRRDPATWTYTDVIPVTDPVTDRGYTGHEHMDIFGLVNMNGRLYDPVTGRVLSPDNFIQEPGFSQNYNRYTYAWNNPLKYIDPDGNNIIKFLVETVIRSAIHFVGNVLANSNGGTNLKQAVKNTPLIFYANIQLGGGGSNAGSAVPESSPVNPEENSGPPLATGYSSDPMNGTETAGLGSYVGIGGNSEDNIYAEEYIPFYYIQPAYLMVEGVGLAASYNVKGGVGISKGPKGWQAYVSATGLAQVGNVGDVNFSGKAALLVNDKVVATKSFKLPTTSYMYETGTYPLGDATFLLPRSGKVQLQLSIGYTLDRSLAYPQLYRTINIPIYNTNSYLAPYFK